MFDIIPIVLMNLKYEPHIFWVQFCNQLSSWLDQNSTINALISHWMVLQISCLILINSFGSAIIFPHFLHLVTSNGSYMGIITLTFGSGLFCSMTILFTETLFQWPKVFSLLNNYNLCFNQEEKEMPTEIRVCFSFFWHWWYSYWRLFPIQSLDI